MRPRKIFALLDGELLKQKLQTITIKLLRNKSTFLFLQAVANVYKTNRFTALFLLVKLTRDDIQQLVKCKSVAFFLELSLL